jgi:hypothetical protein
LDVYALGADPPLCVLDGQVQSSRKDLTTFTSRAKHSHSDFIKEERRKWITKSSHFKTFNPILKMMLE